MKHPFFPNFFAEPDKNLYEKLKFLIIFRLTAASLAYFIYLLILPKNNSNLFLSFAGYVYVFLGAVFFITLLYLFVLHMIKKSAHENYLHYFGFSQLFLDLAIISAVVILNGGLKSNLIFLYYLLIMLAAFVFLKSGTVFFTVAAVFAIGFTANLQFYFDLPGHGYFVNNPDKLLMISSLNILGVLIFGWLLYKFSGNIKSLSKNIIERDELIKNAENFNKELINNLTQGVIVLNEEKRIVFINRAAMEIIGNDVFKEGLPAKAGMLYHFNLKIGDLFKDFPANVLSAREGEENPYLRRFEINFKDKVIGFVYSVLKDAGYKPGHYIIIFRDITAIKQMEMDAKINEGLITTGKLAGWLAHEIRNPLSAVITSIDILNGREAKAADMLNSSDAKKLLSIIKTESLRVESLVRDFLGFVKVKTDKIGKNEKNYEYFNLYSFVNYIIGQFYSFTRDKGGSIKIVNRIDRELMVFLEKYRIQQIFINIMENSIYSVVNKFDNIKGRGIIKISSSVLHDEEGKDMGRHLCLNFADNGDGIDEKTLKNVFKPLFSTKKDGTGLGLAITKSIIENLNGLIEIKSKIHKGTLISVKLPIYENQ